MKTKEEVVQEMQQVVEQMRLDDIEELIAAMDDKRLEADCEFLKQEEKRLEN